jgi:hypothetical protein
MVRMSPWLSHLIIYFMFGYIFYPIELPTRQPGLKLNVGHLVIVDPRKNLLPLFHSNKELRVIWQVYELTN